ncbi:MULTISPECIES: hypothetical protein [unclassified Streptomyces]|uniref:hypothetical protein n=1 Tax=unclassified Streptomyces TaxID=2593676 RepID=UPI0033ED668F
MKNPTPLPYSPESSLLVDGADVQLDNKEIRLCPVAYRARPPAPLDPGGRRAAARPARPYARLVSPHGFPGPGRCRRRRT